MSAWKIEIGPEPVPQLVEVLNAQAIWKRLSKPAQNAVLDAYPGRMVRAHRNTLAALTAHGFVECPFPKSCKPPCPRPYLTEAGKAVAKWNRP